MNSKTVSPMPPELIATAVAVSPVVECAMVTSEDRKGSHAFGLPYTASLKVT